MRPKTWKQVFKYLIPDFHFGRHTEKKSLLAFEFGILLSDCAHELKIPMTSEMVIRAEEVLTKELKIKTAEEFAVHMGVLALAVLEPKD